MANQINRRSGNDRRANHTNASFPLPDSEGIIVAQDRRISCDRRSDGLELTEVNLSQKVFQAAFKQFQKLECSNISRRLLTPTLALCIFSLTSFAHATESEGTIPRIITAPAEPLEVVLLCPEGSQHEGELVPKWVTNDEATDYFCNDSTEEMEISE